MVRTGSNLTFFIVSECVELFLVQVQVEPTVCTGFYLFALCSSFLIYFLSHLSLPYSIPALHVVFLPCNSAGLRLPFLPCSYTFFPSTTLLVWLFSLVFLSQGASLSLSLSLSLSRYTDYHNPLHPTTCNNTIGWHHTTETFHRPHILRYVNSILELQAFSLDSRTLRLGLIVYPETSIRNYQCWLHNNPEQRCSQWEILSTEREKQLFPIGWPRCLLRAKTVVKFSSADNRARSDSAAQNTTTKWAKLWNEGKMFEQKHCATQWWTVCLCIYNKRILCCTLIVLASWIKRSY